MLSTLHKRIADKDIKSHYVYTNTHLLLSCTNVTLVPTQNYLSFSADSPVTSLSDFDYNALPNSPVPPAFI